MSQRRESPRLPGPARRWRRLAAVGTAVEALALAVGGLWSLAVVVRGVAESVAVDLSLAAFALVLAALLGLATRAVLGGRERVRGPVITWQLLQAATAGTLIGGASAATPLAIRLAAWVAAVLALLVVAALLVDASRRDR